MRKYQDGQYQTIAYILRNINNLYNLYNLYNYYYKSVFVRSIDLK